MPTTTVLLVEFASLDCKSLSQSSPGPYRTLQNLLLLSCSFKNVQAKLVILGSNLMFTKLVTSPRWDEFYKFYGPQHADLTDRSNLQ